MADRIDYTIGERVDGKYTVQKQLGEGAFGKVYRVGDGQGGMYALKLLKLWEVLPELRDQLVSRFEMEYETGQIDSPYLVHSLARGEAHGNPYFVMEFCPGGDLRGADRAMDWNVVARQVLLGLKALHLRGKVHRDLKPENVMIKSDGTAALTDFGISGDCNKRMTERNILGKPQQMFGTYAYMPPEQVNPPRGNATVLPTTDIFSFGVMMYELLTGVLPFGELNDNNDLVNYIRNGREGRWNRSPLSLSHYGSVFKPVIEGCLKPDYRTRLQSVDSVLALLPKADVAHDKVVDSSENFLHGNSMRLRVMQGEEHGQTYDLTRLAAQSRVITMGREDVSVRNVIGLREEQSCYISRRHCTLEYNAADGAWFIRDGQWDSGSAGGWKASLNGTYVGSKEVGPEGYYLQPGDIISIGDAKLRVEAY